MARSESIQGWIQELEGGRLEVFLKTEGVPGQPDRKIRCSGPEADMVELVQWFEGKTGLQVNHRRLPRRSLKPIPGQIAIEVPEHELPSAGKVEADGEL